jgi:hypothetical protein
MKEYILYGGDVVLNFDEEAHKYTYNGATVVSVTTVTDAVLDKSHALIPWALKMGAEFLYNNWPIDGIIPRDSPVYISLIEGMKKSHYRKKRAAADVGTIAHKWIEEYIQSIMRFEPSPPKPQDLQALHAVNAFLDWESRNHVVYLASELKIYSRKYGYAGTLDILAEVNGVLTLLDIKTSNTYRKEYALQTAAYTLAYNEESTHVGRAEVTHRIILMLPKDGESEIEEVVRSSNVYMIDTTSFVKARELYSWSTDKGNKGNG